METLGFNSPSLNPENELPQWQQKIANAENKYSSIANNIWVRMDFLHEVQFSAGIGPAHFLAETTRPLGRGCLHFHLLYSQPLSIFEISPQRYAFLSKYPTKTPKFFKNHQNFENFCRKIWRLSFFSISLHPLNRQTRRFCTIRYNPVSSDWRDG